MLSNIHYLFRRGLPVILAILLPVICLAELPPAKPYAQLVDEVAAFLFSDVGENGIRTNDNDPDGYPVPPYFYSFAIDDLNNLDGRLQGYPGYLSVSYPAYTAAVAIDAFLDWRRWSGDDDGLMRARQYADWILEHRTPADDLFSNLPYSTQTDAVMGGGWDGPAIMPDKAPMFGLRLLRLYDITGEIAYLEGAEEIADVMAAVCSHGQNIRGIAADGRMFTTIKDLIFNFHVDNWYEQNFNTVKYYLEIMALESELAPYDETHILAADHALTSIIFLTDGALLEYATAGNSGSERIKVPGKPGAVFAGGFELPELDGRPTGTPGWFFDSATGMVSVYHESSPVVIMSPVSNVEGSQNLGASVFKLRSLGGAAIGVDLSQGGDLYLAVYDLQGRLVRELATGDRLTAGTHRIEWDGRDRHGRTAASGVYLVQGRSGRETATVRVVQVR